MRSEGGRAVARSNAIEGWGGGVDDDNQGETMKREEKIKRGK